MRDISKQNRQYLEAGGFVLSLAACMSALHGWHAGAFDIAFSGYVLVLLSAIALCGLVLLRVFNLEDAPAGLAFAAGAGALSHLLLLAHLMNAGRLLPIVPLAVAVSAALVLLARAPRGADHGGTISGLALAALLIIALYAGVWSFGTLARYDAFMAGGNLNLWSDTFIHAGTISEIGDWRAAGRGSTMLADTPQPLYHYASFTLPATVTAALDKPGLETMFTVWIPLGIAVMMSGILALAGALMGSVGAILAILVFIALPDAGHYGLANGLFAFHWLIEISPGSMYAIGLCCASLSVALHWIRSQKTAHLVLALLLAAMVFFTRAHIAVWFIPALIGFIILAARAIPLRARIGVFLLAGIAGTALLYWVDRSEIAADGVRFFTKFFDLAHKSIKPTNYEGFYADIAKQAGGVAAFLAGFPLTFAAIAGVLGGTFLLGLAVAARRKLLLPADIFPLVLLAFASLMFIAAPTPFHGDFADMRHRAFVLLVVVLLVWSVAFAVRLLPGLIERAASLSPAAWLITAIPVLAFAYVSLPGWKEPSFSWRKPFYGLTLADGLLAAGVELRQRAGPQDSFLLAGGDANARAFDDATVLLGVSGMPAYLSRPNLLLRGAASLEAQARLAAAGEIDAAPTYEDAMRLLSARNIRWYVTNGAGRPAWDADGARAVFKAGATRIYQAPPSRG